MEKSEMIEMLDRAKGRMADREETGRSCMMAIIAALGYIIERLDEKGEAPAAEVESAGSRYVSGKSFGKADKKPEKQPKRKKLDYGRITALHNAGWTQKKIGEDIGVSQNAVSVALRKYQEYMKSGYIWDPEQREFIKKGVRDEKDSEGCQNGSRHDAAEGG